jgi:hypothetical protein
MWNVSFRPIADICEHHLCFDLLSNRPGEFRFSAAHHQFEPEILIVLCHHNLTAP